MSCPTCSATMQGIAHGVFWCPRCGSLKNVTDNAEVPKLVERCREFGGAIRKDPPWGFISNLNSVQTRFAENVIAALHRVWVKLGVEESIHPPEERSTE